MYFLAINVRSISLSTTSLCGRPLTTRRSFGYHQAYLRRQRLRYGWAGRFERDRDDPKIKRYPLDPKKRKELLAKAGYPNGVEVKLYFSPDRYPKAREVCQVIADQLAKAGVKNRARISRICGFLGQGRGQRRQNSLLLCRAAGGRCGHPLRAIFSLRSTKRLEYKNPEFDQLIDEEQTTGDKKKRVALLQQAGRILMEDAPFVPLYTLAEIYGVARNVIWKAHPEEKVLGRI